MNKDSSKSTVVKIYSKSSNLFNQKQATLDIKLVSHSLLMLYLTMDFIKKLTEVKTNLVYIIQFNLKIKLKKEV